jgi:signal transduction histidine kinase
MTKVMMQTFPKNIDIQTNFSAEPWLLIGDATQLHQVLLNLCVNARDAMGPKGGILRVACENMEVDEHLASMNPGSKLGPHVCFSVTDTGEGMTPEVMEKIFDPFFTTKAEGKGTGLGLATVIGIVKGHKGFITNSGMFIVEMGKEFGEFNRRLVTGFFEGRHVDCLDRFMH